MRKVLALSLVAAVGLVPASAAVAKKGPKAGKAKGKNVVFLGLASEVGDGSLAVSMIKGNRKARDLVEETPGDLNVLIGEDTRLRDKGETLALADLRVGDGVKVKARMTDDGLLARKVRLRPHRYHGTVESYDPGTGMGTMIVEKANRVGSAYLAVLGNPASVPFTVTPESQMNGVPMAGDEYEMRGRPTADTTGVEVLRMNVETPSP